MFTFEIVNHGIENDQYFQGCGTAFTDWTYCWTGIGQNLTEAVDDACDNIASGGSQLTASDYKAILEQAKQDDNGLSVCGQCEDRTCDNGECEVDGLYYYASVRYSL